MGKSKSSVSTAKSSNATRKKIEGVELDPDAWAKFEKLVKSAAKMGPKPHVQGSKGKPK